MSSVILRKKIKEYLADGTKNTTEIQSYINSETRHGTTSQQLGNVLSKDKDIVKVGSIRRDSIISGRYDIGVWGMKNWVREKLPDWNGEQLYLDDNKDIQYVVQNSELERRLLKH